MQEIRLSSPLLKRLITGAIATLMALAVSTQRVRAQTISNLWRLKPGDRTYINTDSTQRGIAYNSVSNLVLMASRTGGNLLVLLDPETGAEVGRMNTSGISGGTLAFNMIACGDDGAVYGFNLYTTALTPAPNVKVYRWPSTDTTVPPTVAYQGDPSNGIGGRWGDQVAVRGSGTNTQILIGNALATGTPSVGGTNCALLVTEDGTTFKHYRIDIAGLAIDGAKFGLAFYTNNTFFGKSTSGDLYLIRYDIIGASNALGTIVRSYTHANVPVTVLDTAPNFRLLAGVNGSREIRMFDISDLTAVRNIGTTTFDTANQNANGTGSIAFGGEGKTNRLYALWSNNGIVALKIVYPTMPVLTDSPKDVTVYNVVSNITLTVGASGPQLSYQWYKDSNAVAGATNFVLGITNPAVSNSGSYKAVITNAYGAVTSGVAKVTINQPKTNDVLVPLWSLPPGSRAYISSSDNSQRGIDYDPINGNVLLVSRTGGNNLYILDGNSGAEIGTMNTAGISGGTFAINLVGIADDGVVYAGNLDTGTKFILYRWASVDPAFTPTIAFGAPTGADPSLGNAFRFGDTMAVRGAGANTQILLGTRTNTWVSILTTTDGENFTANPINVPNVPGGFAGLGVAWGDGNTFYTKANGLQMRKIAFTLAPEGNTATVLGTNNISSNISTMDVDPQRNLLAGLALETPDNTQMYLIQSPSKSILLDQEFFYDGPTYIDYDNGNGTGAIAIGGSRVFALDTNNGLRAFTLTPPPGPLSVSRENSTVQISWPGGATLQSAADPGGPYTDVQGATSPYSITPADGTQMFYRLKVNP